MVSGSKKLTSARQVRSTEVLLPSGIGEEATLPGLMGSFGAVVSWHRETGLIRFSIR